jgi:rhamnose utilization protein RhaD (predicted bifunctional aldolase and dehydrogenase)
MHRFGPHRASIAPLAGETDGAETLRPLLRRAHLLGATGIGMCAGSSSAKLPSASAEEELLWVTGVGQGLSSSGASDLVGLRLSPLLPLMDRKDLCDEQLLAALVCRGLPFTEPGRAAEALLHALVPATHVDFTCSDAVMTLCDADGGARLTRACFGASGAWIPFERSGLTLAQRVGAAITVPGVQLAMVAKRGLLTWGDTAEECYVATAAATRLSAAFVTARARGPRCGGPTLAPLDERRRDALLGRILPVLQRELSTSGPKVLEIDVSPELLAFVCARDAPTLSQVGPACPQHVADTKRLPLWIDYDPASDGDGQLAERIVRSVARYRARARWEAAAFTTGRAMLDPSPRVVLIGGVAMIAAGADRAAARRARAAYRHTITVIGNADAIDRFVSLTPLECSAFEPRVRPVRPP